MTERKDNSPFRVSSLLAGERETNDIEDNEPEEAPIAPGQMVRRTVSRNGANVNELRSELDEIRAMLLKINERGSVDQKVFDSLHTELKEYKNDFFYERLKPIVRPLLFLHDSLSQLDREISTHQSDDGEMQKTVRDNLSYFSQQLEEVLTICEVTPISETSGAFDNAIHKVVDTVAVEPEHDNTVQKVVRGGWYLNGTLLRPIEVVRGRVK